MKRYAIARRPLRQRRWSPAAALARAACITDHDARQAIAHLRMFGYELAPATAAAVTVN